MPKITVPLIKGDKTSSETDYRDLLPVNMYAVDKTIFSEKGYLIEHDGIAHFADVPGLDRGAIYNERQEKHFRLSGNSLISVDKLGNVSTLGTISGAEQASFDYSFNTQCVVADGRMFLYNLADGFVEVTDSDLGTPLDVCWVDNYYFLTDGEYVYHTDVDDETAIDPLKFATAEFIPDPSIGLLKTSDNKVAVFGRYTIEYFVDVAAENFAFSRVQSRAQKIGIVATHAKVEHENIFYIVGGSKGDNVSVYAVSVGGSLKVGNREIDKIIAEYTEPELSDIRVEKRLKDDIAFIIIHLPDTTLCFNINVFKKAGKEYAWSILKTDVTGDMPWRSINGIFDPYSAKWIYGDKRQSVLGYLDNKICTQYDEKVEWIIYSPLMNLEKKSVSEMELTTIPGYSDVDDATIAFSMTHDGNSYGTEYFSLYGEPNKFNKRYIQRRLGYVSDIVGFKFRGVSESRMAFASMALKFK